MQKGGKIRRLFTIHREDDSLRTYNDLDCNIN